ncbi:MAG: SH3 domain-containing protein, partial [Oscillospiraceae bacterium]|nr:SH3 domain-containing protein [Oscillospiraceae bacterium]
NLRSSASTSSSVIGQLSNGQIVTVLSTSNGWSYVQTSSGQKGYCNSTYLLTNSTSSGTTTTAKTATVKVSSALNLRSGASTSSSVIGQLSNGQVVTVLSTSNGWSYVQTSSGQKGYCNSAYLLTNSTSSGTTTTTTTKTAIVKVSSALNLRSSASTSSSVIGQLSNGQIVTVLSTSNGWSYVQTSSGQKGYCSASYLVVTSSTQSASKLLAGLPAYKQSDSAWSGTTLGSSGKTIGTIGCTITSLAMSESYRTNSRVTPNDIARECSFTSGGGLYWPSNYYEMAGSNLTAVYQQLKAGKPVIVGGSSSTSSHWVIIKGYQNVPTDTNGNPTSLAASMFLINDPGYNNSTLAEYFTQFPSGHVFRTY